jgi:hypothetical protein
MKLEPKRLAMAALASICACSQGQGPDLDLSARLAPGQVRAGPIRRPSELIGGPIARGKIGDFKIYNSRVAFVIEQAGTASGYLPYGGKVLDADRIGASGEPGRSRFGEWILGFDQRVCAAERVRVVSDGTNGRAAVVRVEGPDAEVPLLESLLAGIFPTRSLNSWITIDYVLEPDADVLRVEVTLENRGSARLDVQMRQMGFLMGDGAQPFQPGLGFEPDLGTYAYYAAVATDVSYGVFDQEPLRFILSYSGILFASQPGVTLLPGQRATFRQYLAVGEGDTVSLTRAWQAATGKPRDPTVQGRVVDAAGAPVAGARVHAIAEVGTDTDRHVAVARTAADGTYALDLSPGAYVLRATGPDLPASEAMPVSVPSGATVPIAGPTLRAADTGLLRFRVATAGGAAMPAKITIRAESQSPSPRLSRRFGLPRFAGGAERIVFSASGEGEVRIPAGRYRVFASRGFEYTLGDRIIDVPAGGSATAAFTLARVVDTAGWLSGDFHLHAQASPDSDDLDEVKVAAFAAENLEVPVSTDHEFIADYAPVIERLGLAAEVRSIVGQEVTTVTIGHFNAFPLAPDPRKRNHGSIDWYYKKGPEIFAAIRANPARPLLQVNHPRSVSVGGYFSAVGYDPVTGTIELPDQWTDEFDAIEVVNGKGGEDPFGAVFADWYSFLNRGKRYVATGNSDSHHAYRTEVGYPRNYVRVPSDDLPAFDAGAFVQGVKGGRVIVSGGPFLSASIGGKGPGEDASAPGGTAEIEIVVQAPPWMDVDRLVVIANGAEAHARDLGPGDADPANPVVRFRGTIALRAERDTWYVVHVRGSRSLDPVVTGARPFAFTNPIFVDVDGNGRFDAPGSP